MVVKKIFGWIVLIVLAAIYSILIGAYFTFGFYETLVDDNYGITALVLFILLIFLFLILVVFFVSMVLKKRSVDKSGKYRMILIAVLLAVTLPVLKDSAPIENDYSWADLKSPPKNAQESFEILKNFFANEDLHTDIELPKDLDRENFTNIDLYEEEIVEAWNQSHTLRKYIERLNSFDGIADFTEPSDNFFGFLKLRNISDIYRAYAVLRTKQGRPEEGIRALIEIHSVASKALPYSRYIIDNLLWAFIAKNNIRTACIIASSDECKYDNLVSLKEGFKPLLKYDKPFSNMFTSEYLFMKYFSKEKINCSELLELIFPNLDQDEINQSMPLKALSVALIKLTYKQNRTLSDIRSYYVRLINSSTIYSDFSTAQNYIEKYEERQSFVNSSGWMLISSENYDFRNYYTRMIELVVENDLLTLYLNGRIGEQDELIDCFSGNNYLKSEEVNHYFSVGIDGMPGTTDDISLGKWLFGNEK